jgi:phosphatidate phosphatase APP1
MINTALLAWVRSKFRDQRPILLVPYLGYGTPQQASLFGRVLRDPGIPPPEADDSAWENLLATWDRIESDELPGIAIRAELSGVIAETISDDEGYFELSFQFEHPIAFGWHAVLVEATAHVGLHVQGQVCVAPSHGLGIISDIDDTVLRADVANPVRLAQLMLLENATTREIFAGVAAFYRALAGADQNPIFYISGSPWNLYDLLIDVFARHQLPRGPLLLTSLERDVVLPKLRGRKVLQAHKLRQIEQLLATYPAKRFVLLGDSSQHDPEIYQQIATIHPDRIAAIYIRDVTGAARDQRVLAIGQALQQAGIPFVYAGETQAFVEHAASIGIISQISV